MNWLFIILIRNHSYQLLPFDHMSTKGLNILHKKTELWRDEVICPSPHSHNLNIFHNKKPKQCPPSLWCLPSEMKKSSLPLDPEWEDLSPKHGNCDTISWIAGYSLFNPWEKGWSMKLSAGPWGWLLSGIIGISVWLDFHYNLISCSQHFLIVSLPCYKTKAKTNIF